MIQLEKSSLTSNDEAVLSALFDPESSPSSLISISKTAPSLPHIPDTTLPDLQRQELEAIKSLDHESPSRVSIESAISNLSHLIVQQPQYAPAYLNRAQATRLLIGEERDLFQPQNSNLISRILSDLNQTISLATPTSPSSPLSNLQATILSKAHTHRGYLCLKASHVARTTTSKPNPATATTTNTPLPPETSGITAADWEEMASKDFFLGGRYGNKIAQELSVKTNPYAKMCGEIVREAMRKEVS